MAESVESMEKEGIPYEQEALEAIFLEAAEALGRGQDAPAEAGFRAVLEGDPRLPEPRLELAVILYRRGELEEAEGHARVALEQIEKGWQWLDNFDPLELESHGRAVLGEILISRALELEDGGGQPLWREAESLFRRALELTPDNGDLRAQLAGFKGRRKAGQSGQGAKKEPGEPS